MSTDGPYLVGPDYEYLPANVDVSECGHTTSEPHQCVHDWRVTWGNLPQQQGG